MASDAERFDALVVGGGFYGCSIALFLRRVWGLGRVLLVEREDQLLGRASLFNQARVHNGYHYPRSFTTAFRSRVNFPRFVAAYSDCVRDDFLKVYAIARRNSQVTAGQFARFCREIGAEHERAPAEVRGLFSRRLIEEVFLVREIAFDAEKLRQQLERELAEEGVTVWLGAEVRDLAAHAGGALADVSAPEGACRVAARFTFNCTYAGLNRLGPAFGRLHTPLKFEIAELALLRMPPPLERLGVTVMDGPFFSCMPFPARGVHSLSHVRYTPHAGWTTLEEPEVDPYAVLAAYRQPSRAGHMVRDAARYLPALAEGEMMGSLMELKALMVRNEADDGRPILLEAHPSIPGSYSVLGGKIDNIFDVLEQLEGTPEVAHA